MVIAQAQSNRCQAIGPPGAIGRGAPDATRKVGRGAPERSCIVKMSAYEGCSLGIVSARLGPCSGAGASTLELMPWKGHSGAFRRMQSPPPYRLQNSPCDPNTL